MSKLDTIIKKIVNTSDKLNAKALRRYTKKRQSMKGDQIPILVPEHNTDIHEMVRCCREEIQRSEDSGIMPDPKYFEQVAILSRAAKRYENEIAICEMYIELMNQYAAREKLTDAEISTNLLPNCAPFVKRIHNARIMIGHD